MATVGIAIPCYRGHIQYVDALLQNIASSTHLPTQVAISCSGWDRTGTLRFTYCGFRVDILYTTKLQGIGTNRNIAANALTTDLITFLDVDDLMHPKRIAYLRDAFEQSGCDAVYHGFVRLHRDHLPTEHADLGPLDVSRTPCDVMAAHVTVRSSLFRRIQFDERPSSWRQEDTVYRKQLIADGVSVAYVSNPLTYYLYLGNP
jgi:glycosyltransferase involved in cell wall biosynthesis